MPRVQRGALPEAPASSRIATGRGVPRPQQVNQSMILRSWGRCDEQYGIDRGERSQPTVVENATLSERVDEYGEFVRLARAEISTLYQQIAGSGYALLLTSADGLILDSVSDPNLKRDFRAAGLWLGAVWDERTEGTNGVGTCIVERQPVTVHRDQHFRSRHHALSCSGAPILDPRGELLGVLDASSVNARDTPESQLHTLALVTMSAQHIAKCYFVRNFPDALLLRFHARPEYVGLINDAAMAVSEQGLILAVDQNALNYLGVADRNALVGSRVDQVFDLDLAQLDQLAGARQIRLRPIRSLNHGTQYFASAEHGRDMGVPGDRAREARNALGITSARRNAGGQASLGKDDNVQRQAERARRVMTRGIPILLQGETGTGKEWFARALHDGCAGRDQPFVAVNCAAIPEHLIESELFGYEAGAFTGAQKGGRRGKIAQADGGTLFLDEIGDMPLELQSRLLRVLEQREVIPLGGDRAIPVDIHLVSATHCDLQARVGQGQFRQDLFYRLKGLQVELPALRDRSDLDDLIDRILREEGGPELHLGEQARARLLNYHWPGNLRELRNELRTAAALSDAGVIHAEDLSTGIAEIPQANGSRPRVRPTEATRLANAERDVLIDCLRRHDWNVTRTAEALSLGRSTLYRRMRRHGIDRRSGGLPAGS
ncbi:sigma-54-dependent Fis family transcriptional regulator [Aquisalimonas lutea]|uniref:sigma-54-dependent Fis family transcriptional regulator n=1 Tax=Aquisalimonas lutea TaxID=1327750 RepID=UPI0025B4B52C|nr:sigma-54-dependent Fis family transcriptional regulator [Aquisalimonas lutea]MDN3516073.1 sigma-54-dependent Fis family transcriptional regulator [Aquisalimonas lutea]